ncbi:MAG: translation elongation factor Ts [Alphaproteobacteria bacterium]|nr:translation elongation factor Ts [Alphaproteobacteria bacterium]
MAEITAALVKELRERTGVGMMDCKKALVETSGADYESSAAWLEAARDWLRAKGLSKAAKKPDRIAAEGLVGVASNGSKAALVEVNSETDFVGRNEEFQRVVRDIAAVALENEGDAARTLHATLDATGTVGEVLVNLVARIGENINLRRAAALSVSEGVVATYIHNSVADGLGRIGVLVALESTADKSRLNDLGRKIAMHIAAAKPLAATTAELDPRVVEKERAVLVEQARESGKAAGVIEKMVEGRLRKFYQETVLVEQAFVMDPDVTVGKFIDDHSRSLGSPVKLIGFAKFEVGEGIEKPPNDFGGDVAALTGS